jgi:hypothetical protein
VKADPGEPVEQPGKEVGSAQQEARTCLVCGTKSSPLPTAISVRFVSCGELLAGNLQQPGTGFSDWISRKASGDGRCVTNYVKMCRVSVNGL